MKISAKKFVEMCQEGFNINVELAKKAGVEVMEIMYDPSKS